MSNYPEKFIIPEDRIPRPWSQGTTGLCGYASVTKVMEVWDYRRTGDYAMLSKFYTAGRHASPNIKNFEGSAIDYDYTMNSILNRGSVPEEMCDIYSDIPYVIDDIANLPNITELDKEAEKTKIKSFARIPGNAFFRDNVKKYLYEQQMPLIGNVTGQHHCVVIVGWDGKEWLCHDHDGSDRIVRLKCNDAYALEGYLDNSIDDVKEEVEMPEIDFIDVSENRWSYDAIKYVAEKGIMKGTTANVFEPAKPLTREEAATIIYRLFNKEYI